MLRGVAAVAVPGGRASLGALRVLGVRGLAGEAQGFSSPGNTGVSEEMKEVGRPEEVRRNEEATQRHLFSEKDRFNQERYENAEDLSSPFGKAFSEPGDTAPGRAVSESTGRTSGPSQSLGINIIPEKLAHAKADEAVPEAPMNTPGAKPGEITPDNAAGQMGPLKGTERSAPGGGRGGEESPLAAGAAEGGGGGGPAAAGAEGEPEDIIEEMHKGDEWAS